MPLSAILDATAAVSPGRPRTDTISQDPAVRRRYRSIYNEIERAELNAMVAVLELVSRNMAERAEREGTLAEAIA